MIRIVRGAEPKGLQTASRKRLWAAVEAFNQHGAPSKALKRTLTGYGSQTTKKTLYLAQQGKCAWCESRTPFSSAPVEWLTWTWSNLLFSCARCNDRGHKANYFPLRPGTAPATAPTSSFSLPPPSPLVDVSTEEPLLLDPAGSEDPIDHIAWFPAKTTLTKYDWIWTPLGLTEKGDATIAILKLEELAESVQWHVRRCLLPSIEEVEQHLTAGRTQAAHRRWNRLLKDNLAPSAEWSAFTWYALGHLVPDQYRSRHKLAAPTRPGAP